MNITLEVVVDTDLVRVQGGPMTESVRALVDELRLAAINPTLFSNFRVNWSQFAAQAMALENAIVYAQKEGQKVEVDEHVTSIFTQNKVAFNVGCRIELPLQAAS